MKIGIFYKIMSYYVVFLITGKILNFGQSIL